MEDRGDKSNRTALDREKKGIKGLVSTTCLNEKDEGGSKGGKEFCFGQVHCEMLVSHLRGDISRHLAMQDGEDHPSKL